MGYLRFLAVLADCLNAFAVGAPLAPGLRIFSPLPLAILFRLAWILAYNPLLAMDYHFVLCDQYRADILDGLESWALCLA
jgi:hypothetical protein